MSKPLPEVPIEAPAIPSRGASSWLPASTLTEETASFPAPLASRTAAGRSSRPTPRFATHQLVAGRFLIRRLLGQGGIAQVFEATDLELRQPVAIKALRPDLTADRSALEVLRHEARVARRVTHPHVCRVHDLFWHDSGAHGEEDGRAALVSMELVRGESLQRRLRRLRRLTDAEGLEVARQLAAALAAVHRAGLIHGDLKPSNVLLEDGHPLRAVVSDFGVARVVEGPPEGRCEPFGGTRSYMAPEQGCGDPLTPAADLYGWGLVVLECLTGRPASGGPPPLGAIDRGTAVGRRLLPVLRRALSAAPDRRPVDGAELASRLELVLAGAARRRRAVSTSRAAPPTLVQ